MAFGKLPGLELDALSLRVVRAVYDVWERRPPPHRCAAMLLEAQTTWKPKEKGRARESSPEDLAALAGELGLPLLPQPKK